MKRGCANFDTTSCREGVTQLRVGILRTITCGYQAPFGK